MLTASVAALLAALAVSSTATSRDLAADDPPAAAPGHSWGWTGAGVCPHYCTCYRASGLRRVDCVGRRLGGVNLGLPVDTEMADLSDNVISTLDDGCFLRLGLVQLRELSLRHNAVRDVHPWALAGLRRLRSLDLSHNHLQALHPSTFADNGGLKTLLLAGNNLARVPSDAPVLAAPRLQVLDLSDCKLAHVGPSFFAELPALASLNLSSNLLIQLQPQALARQRQLQMLDLTRNPLACDANTRSALQQLGAGNVTVRHSCPPTPSAAAAAQLHTSRHLARLMADVAPPPPAADAAAEEAADDEDAPPAPRIAQGVAESTRATHESVVEEPDHIGGLGPEYFEEGDFDENPADPSSGPSGHSGAPATPGQGRGGFARDCPPLFPERNSKNPATFKDWFDPIPSFWAAVFGGWLGFVLGLVLSSCACHLSFWRALCLGAASSPPDRAGGRSGRRPAPGGRRPARRRLSLELAYSEAAEALGLPLCPPTPPALLGRRAYAPLDTQPGARPETPPPRYSDLVRGGFCSA